MSQVNYSSTKLKPVIRNYGCRSRMPHDFSPLFESDRVKIEVCRICNTKVRFKKYYKGRTDNRAYLEAKARVFAQPRGRTKRLYYKLHNPDQCRIVI